MLFKIMTLKQAARKTRERYFHEFLFLGDLHYL